MQGTLTKLLLSIYKVRIVAYSKQDYTEYYITEDRLFKTCNDGIYCILQSLRRLLWERPNKIKILVLLWNV